MNPERPKNAVPIFLVALDASSRAPHVLEAAVDLARARGARLILMRAVGIPAELPIEAFAMPPDDLPGMLEDLARKDLDKAAATVPAGMSTSQIIRQGVPWDAIVFEAKELNADLIVLGSHGYSGIDRLLGTTAAKVVNHAPCSVLVVR